MARRSREELVLGLRLKLAIQYGLVGFLFGCLWAWLALKLHEAVDSGWLSGLLSGFICFIICGEVIMKLFSYLADGTWSTLLSRSTEYSRAEKLMIGMLFFYGFHGAILGVVAYFVLDIALKMLEVRSNDIWWYFGGGVLGLLPAVWYGWTEVE
jgi:hypothetical protein